MSKSVPDIKLLKRFYPTKEEFMRLQTDESYRDSEIKVFKEMYDFLITLDDAMFHKASEEALARLIETNKTHRMI